MFLIHTISGNFKEQDNLTRGHRFGERVARLINTLLLPTVLILYLVRR